VVEEDQPLLLLLRQVVEALVVEEDQPLLILRL
jgi:hypothetical protein